MLINAPWLVRTAVGSRPVILGKKLTQRYFSGEGYFECDIDIGSSVIANRCVSICRNASTYVTVDMGLVLEGITTDQLPERVFATLQFNGIDFSMAQDLLDYI